MISNSNQGSSHVGSLSEWRSKANTVIAKAFNQNKVAINFWLESFNGTLGAKPKDLLKTKQGSVDIIKFLEKKK